MMWEGVSTVSSENGVILDACCLINLYATGRCAQILTALPYTFAAARGALDEANYLARRLDDGTYEQQDINWAPLIEGELIKVFELETEAEEALFVDLSIRLDDGEAATLAIGIERGYTVATDEKKATNLLRDDFPGCLITDTLSLLREWEQIMAPSPDDLAHVLRSIRDLAHYRPGPGHSLYEWWISGI